MPLTPKFSIDQDDEFVILEIHVPWVKITNMEFVIDGQDFSFWCQPYLLKLHFPYRCVDDERAKAQYDIDNDNGTMIVYVPKEIKGQNFPDLDLISRLLPPTKIPKAKGELITEIKDEQTIEQEVEQFLEKEDALITKKKSMNKDLLSLEKKECQHKYGFNNMFDGVFVPLYEVLSDYTSLSDPEHSTEYDRYERMKEDESNDFDGEQYIQDYLEKDDYIYEEAIPHWVIADRYLRKMRKAQQKEEEERQKQQVKEINQSTEVIEVHAPPKDSSSTAVDLHIVQQKEETTSNNTSLPKKKPLITVIEESSEEVKEPPATSEKKEPREECICSYLEVQSVVVQHYVQQNIPIIQPLPPLPESTILYEETSATCSYTSEEKQRLTNIKKYVIQFDEEQQERHVLMLLDILLGYIYDNRFTQNDPSVESPWTICILSSSLSYLCTSKSLKEVLVQFIKRCCTYPYIRKYTFAKLCIKDLAILLRLGRRRIIKCLLELQSIFEHSDTKYIYNKLYINPMIYWVQTLPQNFFKKYSDDVEYLYKCELKKEDIGIGIEQLEQEAKQYM